MEDDLKKKGKKDDLTKNKNHFLIPLKFRGKPFPGLAQLSKIFIIFKLYKIYHYIIKMCRTWHILSQSARCVYLTHHWIAGRQAGQAMLNRTERLTAAITISSSLYFNTSLSWGFRVTYKYRWGMWMLCFNR